MITSGSFVSLTQQIKYGNSSSWIHTDGRTSRRIVKNNNKDNANDKNNFSLPSIPKISQKLYKVNTYK